MIVAVKIVSIRKDYRVSEKLYQDTKDKYVVDYSPKESIEKPDGPIIIQPEPIQQRAWYDMVSVDLESLQEINPDIIGWIYFENEDISYPVLYSGDNDTYLRANYMREYANGGSIFMDGSNEPDFGDRHTLIYGHNMKDLSMFGKLRYYKTNEDYYENHRYFQIVTKEAAYRYEIFACKDIAADSDIYTIYKQDAQGLFEFAKDKLATGSYVSGGIYVAYDDYVITLSTCTENDGRFVVSAVRVDTHERID